MSLTKGLSVADNARDVVLLHVPASSERQEWRNETGLKRRRIKGRILKLSDVYRPAFL
jgi:hypothetical protein